MLSHLNGVKLFQKVDGAYKKRVSNNKDSWSFKWAHAFKKNII